jgi:hypothetical protein
VQKFRAEAVRSKAAEWFDESGDIGAKKVQLSRAGR